MTRPVAFDLSNNPETTERTSLNAVKLQRTETGSTKQPVATCEFLMPSERQMKMLEVCKLWLSIIHLEQFIMCTPTRTKDVVAVLNLCRYILYSMN